MLISTCSSQSVFKLLAHGLRREKSGLTEFPVVQDVEERHGAEGQLNQGGEAAVLGLHVLVVPPPVGAADGAAPVDGVHRPAGEPAGQLAQLDLGQRGVL